MSGKLMFGVIVALTMLVSAGCGTQKDDSPRLDELAGKVALWQSEILIADPEMPDMKHIIPLYDSYDASLYKAWNSDSFTTDYIPESVMAFAIENYRDKPRTITLRLGDLVEVLESKTNNADRMIYLIRTQDGTYAWLYAFHLNDKNGKRLATL